MSRDQPLPVDFETGALEDFERAFLWYRSRSATAATAFRRELEVAVQRIGDSPETWPVYHHGTRRWLFHRFPFFVVYRIESDHVVIVAIAHGFRRPGYWQPSP